jgi:hypothetical protein
MNVSAVARGSPDLRPVVRSNSKLLASSFRCTAAKVDDAQWKVAVCINAKNPRCIFAPGVRMSTDWTHPAWACVLANDNLGQCLRRKRVRRRRTYFWPSGSSTRRAQSPARVSPNPGRSGFMFAPTSRLSSVGEMMPLRPPMRPTLGGGFCLRSLRALGADMRTVSHT